MPDKEKLEQITTESLRGSLKRSGSRAFAAYQHGMDASLFLLGGAMLANEKDYTELRSNVRFAPSEKNTLSFERAKFESQRWLLKHNTQDMLRIAIGVIEDVRSVCALAPHAGKQGEDLQQAIQQVTGEARADFARLPLTERLERLKQDFNVDCPQRTILIGLSRLLNCLQLRSGTVTKADADGREAMVIPLLTLNLAQKESEEGGPGSLSPGGMELRIRQTAKIIPVGQPVEFSRAEHMAVILSLCVFTSSLLQEADKFLQSKAELAESSAG